jgi:DUF1680 family protein
MQKYFISLLLLFAIHGFSQSISLPSEVKYKIGDDMNWVNPVYNDADWANKRLGIGTKLTDVKENIYVWYRIRIVIPSSIKALAEYGKGVQLHLGKIDDVDQTFFNGKLLGQTGSFPPNFETKSKEDRVYIIPVNEVQWDKENVIAVRIFSPDPWVGMYEGPYKLSALQWSDFISIQNSIIETSNSGFITKVKFTNNRAVAFDGTINYWIAGKNNAKLFSETKQVHIKPVKGVENEIVFSNYQAVNDNIFHVGFEVKENASPASVAREQLYLANKQLKIEVVSEPKAVVKNKIADAFTPIPFENQQQNGYLGNRMNQNLAERLLKLDEEGTLDGYLQRPGHHPWAGEHIGKYLETACNVWKNISDEKLKLQMDRLMYQLVNSQLTDGYLGTYTPDEYWTSWDVWSHKYNLYGLLAYYKTTGYKPALVSCKKMGDLLCNTFGNKPGQRDIIKAGTHIGMAATSVLDPMVELYKYTGNKKYLDFCYYLLDAMEQDNGPKIISSLLATGNVTKVGNGKAYEMLSNFVGITNLYRVTGDEKLLKPMEIAWQDIVENRLYITGTTSSHEYFQEFEYLPAGNKDKIGEGCVTTTWIQFNQQLLDITGETKYVEQIEKAIYNHLLAAENPQTGCVSYYTPLMDKKPYTCEITCCTSSVPRGIAMIPYFTFGNVMNIPTVMLYESATYKETIVTSNKKNIDVSLKVESNFPETGGAVITVNTSKTEAFTIALRVPSWCTSFVAKIRNKEYQGTANAYLQINRLWKSGEKIKVSFNMPIKTLEGSKSYPNQIAFKRGPQVLAFDEVLNPRTTLETTENRTFTTFENKTISNVLPKQWIGNQVYEVKTKDNQTINLVPFADAGQTAGEVKVWLPLNVDK